MNVILIVLGIIIFNVGILTGYFFRMYILHHSDYDGVVMIEKDMDKILYSLELFVDPEEIQYKNELILKVKPLDEILKRM